MEAVLHMEKPCARISSACRKTAPRSLNTDDGVVQLLALECIADAACRRWRRAPMVESSLCDRRRSGVDLERTRRLESNDTVPLQFRHGLD